MHFLAIHALMILAMAASIYIAKALLLGNSRIPHYREAVWLAITPETGLIALERSFTTLGAVVAPRSRWGVRCLWRR